MTKQVPNIVLGVAKKMRLDGYTTKDISGQLGYSPYKLRLTEWPKGKGRKRKGPRGENSRRVATLFQTTVMLPTEIARELGISRERVRQLLKREGLPTSRKGLCSVCGNPTRRGTECHRHRKHPHTLQRVIIECHICGGTREMYLYDYKRPRKLPFFFCSKHCYGKWLAANYGFGSGKKEIV